jgi:hypothetical protein
MTRFKVEIVHAQQQIVLFADSSHPELDVEELVHKEVALYGRQPTRLLASLIDQRYPSDAGGHRSGERILSLDLEPGMRDVELRITLAADGARVDRVGAAAELRATADAAETTRPAADAAEVADAQSDFAASVVELLRLAQATHRASSVDRWRLAMNRPRDEHGATWPEDIRWRDWS